MSAGHYTQLLSPSLGIQSIAIERLLEDGISMFPAQTQVPLYLFPSLSQDTSTPPPAPLPGWANSCNQQDSAMLGTIWCSSEQTVCGVSCLTRGVFLIIRSLCSSLVRNSLAPSSLQALRDSPTFWSRSSSHSASYGGKTTTLLGQQPQFPVLQIQPTT